MTGDQVREAFERLTLERRSIRKYRPDPVPEAWLTDLIQCALRAPSPSNSRPVRFLHIASPDLKERLHQAMTEGRDKLLAHVEEMTGGKRLRNRLRYYWRYAEFMTLAPVLLAAGTIRRRKALGDFLSEAGLAGGETGDSDLDLTLGLTLQNMLLKAHSLGLGTCILTAPLAFMDPSQWIADDPALRIKCFVTVGFPAETPPAPPMPSLDTFFGVV